MYVKPLSVLCRYQCGVYVLKRSAKLIAYLTFDRRGCRFVVFIEKIVRLVLIKSDFIIEKQLPSESTVRLCFSVILLCDALLCARRSTE